MFPAIPTNRFATGIEVLCALIARHGLARRLAGPLIVLIWGRVRSAATKIETRWRGCRPGAFQPGAAQVQTLLADPAIHGCCSPLVDFFTARPT